MSIKYNSGLFDIVKDLTLINNSIIFNKSESSVIIKRRDPEKTIAYILEVPEEYFDFTGEEVAIYNYNEFYQFFKAFNKPEILIDNAKIYLTEKNAKIDYMLANSEALAKEGVVKNINFTDPDFKIKISSVDLDEIVKMNALIKAKKAKITSTEKTISIRIFNTLHENSFEKEFEFENLTGTKDNIDFTIFSESFTKIPQKRDYVIEIKKEGFIKFQLIDEKIKLNVFTGFVKS